MKIFELLRERFHILTGEKTTFVIDVGKRNVRRNTVSGTDLSTISDTMSSKFEIMEIQFHQNYFFPTEWEDFFPSINKSSVTVKNSTTKIHVFLIL